MKKGTKLWLRFSLVLSLATILMNAYYTRWPSVVIAVIALVGLCMLLFQEKKAGYIIMCVSYGISCAIGIVSGIHTGVNPAEAVTMSIVGSVLIPGITALFLRGQWRELK